MYTAFYGLREKPFALSPDPRFLFLADAHREALAHLLYGIDQGEGFIAITGEVGTGKTTLCRTMLERLGAETEVAFLFNPSRNAQELLQAIALEFGLPSEDRSRSQLGNDLNRFLLDKNREGRRVLLIIDEAQNLTPGTLEQVRLLSNLETSTSKLIQILLLGQPELDRKLDSARLRQLRQRISVRWSLGSLSRAETRAYVRHRIRIAAGADREVFSDAALREIHRRSRGVPRIVNVLCDRALLAGYAARQHRVGVALVRQAAREIRDTRRGAGKRRAASVGRGWLRGALAAGLLLAVLLGSFVVGSSLRDSWVARDARERGAGQVASAPPPAVALPEPRHERPVPLPAPTEEAARSAAPAPNDLAVATALEPAPLYDPAQPSADPTRRLALGGSFLGGMLADHDPAVGRMAAMNAILDAFSLAPQGFLPASEGELLVWLEERGLAVLPLPDTNFETLRALNHPSLLRLHDDRGGSRLVALRGLGEDGASLYGAAAVEPLSVPLSELDEQWSGAAFVIWQDFEAIPDVLSLGEQGSGVLWLQNALSELGFFRGELSGYFDASTYDGVRALQLALDLEPDGAAGPRTQMVLYDLLGRYAVPRLRAREGSG